MKGIIGRKVGMTQVFDEAGQVIPVTVIEAGPCYVTQVRTQERDGYAAIQLGFGEVKQRRLTGGQLGHLKRAEVPLLRYLREFRTKQVDVEEGQRITVDVFQTGERVDIIGTSKGRGFAGAIKRHHFNRQPKTHGASDRTRAQGALGSTTTPGRVIKGRRMAGHMGDARVTSQNLEVIVVDPERNLLAVKGSVPGAKGGIVMIRAARKQPRQKKA